MKKILIACIVSMLMLPGVVSADPRLLIPGDGTIVSSGSPRISWIDFDTAYLNYYYVEIGTSAVTDDYGFFAFGRVENENIYSATGWNLYLSGVKSLSSNLTFCKIFNTSFVSIITLSFFTFK